MSVELPPRWYPLRYHPTQRAYWDSPHRFNVVPAGRRSGKTEGAKRKLVYRALLGTDFYPSRFFASAPTRDQAKRIYWEDLKALSPRHMLTKISDSELMVKFRNGSEIWVLGMDKPQRLEGQPWDGGILDEYADMKEDAWKANIRPALSDRAGWCDFIGVPEGRNHYYDLYMRAKAEMQQYGPASEWGAYTWKSTEVLPKKEVEAAKRDLDPLTFTQEYEASFISFEGRAYYAFDHDKHCAPLTYDPEKPLWFGFDFNVDPGICAVVQEQKLPCGTDGTGVIDEVWIPTNSNTPAVVRKLASMYGDHKGPIVCYGDASGGARGSAKIAGSDWDLVRAEMRLHWRTTQVTYKVDSRNPAERARINAMNTRLLNGSGEIHMMVDPIKAPHVVKDLDGVALLAGGGGEIDKKGNKELSHISDGLGYIVAKEYPIIRRDFREGTRTGV